MVAIGTTTALPNFYTCFPLPVASFRTVPHSHLSHPGPTSTAAQAGSRSEDPAAPSIAPRAAHLTSILNINCPVCALQIVRGPCLRCRTSLRRQQLQTRRAALTHLSLPNTPPCPCKLCRPSGADATVYRTRFGFRLVLLFPLRLRLRTCSTTQKHRPEKRPAHPVQTPPENIVLNVSISRSMPGAPRSIQCKPPCR